MTTLTIIPPETYIGLSVPSKRRMLASRFSTAHARAEQIRAAVCRYFAQDVSDVSSQSRKREFTVPRQVSMYFMKHKTTLSLKAIGEMFDGRDHSTVIYACQTVEDLIDTDRKFAQSIAEIENLLFAIKPENPMVDNARTIGDLV